MEPSASGVEVSRARAVLHIRRDRPEKRNAPTLAMYRTMAEAMLVAQTDDATRGAVLGAS